MDVLIIGTMAGGLAMLIVFVAGYFLLKDRIAPVDVGPVSQHDAGNPNSNR